MRYLALSFPGKPTEHMQVDDVPSWEAVAAKVAAGLRPGHILAISGPLGAGKTTFVQALVRECGGKKQAQSPTFALMRSYPLKRGMNGIGRIIHVDAYRIEDEKELVVLDLEEELADGKSILVLEWPENIPLWIAAHATQCITLSISVETPYV